MNQAAQVFNPEQFLNLTVEDANATELLQVPEGEYTAVSEPVTSDSFKSFDINKGDRAGTKGFALNVVWLINDEDGRLKEFLGRAPKVTQRINLDIGPDGTLEMGKGRNVYLGQLRDALGQNLAGRPWQMGNLGNQVAKIQVKHRVDTASGRTFIEVPKVAKL